jgi:HEAT repeat protein
MEELKYAANGGDWGWRKVAMKAVAKLGEPRAIEPMIEILNKTAFAFELEDTICGGLRQERVRLGN